VPTSNPVHGLHCTVMLGLGLGFVDLIRFFSTSTSLAADLEVHQTVDLSGASFGKFNLSLLLHSKGRSSPCSFELFSQISSHPAVFFSHNKPTNSTFSHNKLVKRTDCLFRNVSCRILSNSLIYFLLMHFVRIDPGNAFRLVVKVAKFVADGEYGLVENGRA
jgi:hypothetical protein